MMQNFYKMDYSEKERLVRQSQVDNNICHKVISTEPFGSLMLVTEQTGFVEWCSTGQQEHVGFFFFFIPEIVQGQHAVVTITSRLICVESMTHSSINP